MKSLYRPMPLVWWLGNRAYRLFVIRELTSVFIAAYLVLFLILLHQLAVGRAAYEGYLRFLVSPWLLAFHILALAAAIFHSLTWFKLAPTAVVVRFRGNRVPGAAVVTINYLAWIVVSAIVAWLVLRG